MQHPINFILFVFVLAPPLTAAAQGRVPARTSAAAGGDTEAFVAVQEAPGGASAVSVRTISR
jgi:hypothetical protein